MSATSPPIPGNIELERRIENIIRWNAVAMVLQAYDSGSGVGGHIATYLSAATMMEVGFNHVFRAASEHYGGDQVHFQAHTAPGVYARAYLEGRLSEQQLANFRRELAEGVVASRVIPIRAVYPGSGRCRRPAWGSPRQAPSTRRVLPNIWKVAA